MTWPDVIFWILIIYGMFKPATFMLYLFFVVQTFTALTLLPPSIAGNIPVETFCAATLIWKTFIGPRRFKAFLHLALDVRRLGLLTLFSVYMVATAFIYPRLFAGTVQIYALNYASNFTPLGPTASNFTQPVYLLMAIGMAFVSARSGTSPEFRRHFLLASLTGASCLLASGIIDMSLGSVGLESWLAPFHNATYRTLDSATVVGQRRVIGFTPEASIFGAACCSNLAFLLFNRRAFEGRVSRRIVPFVTAGLAFMVYASTSSGAYIGLAVIGTILTARFIVEMIVTERFTPAQIRMLVSTIAVISAGAISYFFLPKSLIDHISLLLDSSIFQKSQSFSYLQRNSWTQAGIAAFWATDGIGIGVGSVRTSNLFANFAASTGILGLLLFGGFVLRTLVGGKSGRDPKSKQFANGLKLAMLPGLAVASLSGTTPNPGSGLLFSLGLIYALNLGAKATLAARPGRPPWKPVRQAEPQGGSEAGIA